jgi:hypothetical protein
MSAEIANLLVDLDEVNDNIACRETDLLVDPDDPKAAGDLDDLLCRRADIELQLTELDYYDQS